MTDADTQLDLPPMPLPTRLREIDIARSPGQASKAATGNGTEPKLSAVDFSHGDVDAFPPSAEALAAFVSAVAEGGHAAYTTYRGNVGVRERLAGRLAELTGASVDADRELIVTPGTQAGLFLSLSALVEPGDRVALIEPDYFANRRILRHLGAELVPIALNFTGAGPAAVIDVDQLRAALRSSGAKLLCLSNPNNPTGVVLPPAVVHGIAQVCLEVGVFVVVDQLYCRQVFSTSTYTHLRATPEMRDNCLTLLGPSKTESLSGYRVGVAIGPDWLIDRMEAVLSIVSLRAAGYNQKCLDTWLAEDPAWLSERIAAHEQIRNRIVEVLSLLPGLQVRPAEAGSYLFVRLPALDISAVQFIAELRDDEGIVVTPGGEFGPGFEDYFRINFSQDADRAVAAIERLVQLARARLADGGAS
ncbi:MAG: aspartate aminotransferase [Marmoricola sp.]|nr:aspartate aminotransferase [Marmoricola sp.]